MYAARELDEPSIFVAFEESAAQICGNAASFGWHLDTLPESRLAFMECQPSVDLLQSGSFDLGGLLAALGALANRMGARRVVLDALDTLLVLLPSWHDVRREVFRLHEWLLGNDLTAILTVKRQSDVQAREVTDLDFMQFMVDSAVRLRHDVVEGVSQRSLRILKYRGSAFDENEVPYVIGDRGIELAGGFSDREPPPLAGEERISTGVDRLDRMLDGGYYRAASVLITGSPGTAKTTLAGAFIASACARGENALLVSFDSRVEEVVRNLRSVGIDLQAPLEQGTLRMESSGGLAGSSEIQLMRICRWADAHKARCIAIDPASALANSGNALLAHSIIQRLVDWCKSRGITLVTTSLLDRATDAYTHTPLHISTIADTWIHLEYPAESGERNRGLSIIKSRGTAHSNQIRELILSSEGIDLADVYTAGGEVLMGTLRMERERAEVLQRHRAEEEHRRSIIALEVESRELEQQLQRLQDNLRDKQSQLQEVRESHQDVEQRLRDTGALIRERRQGGRGGEHDG